MIAAIFALAGTGLGIVGALAAELLRRHHEDDRSRKEALRLACADFTDAIIRMREFSVRWMYTPSDVDAQDSARKAHSDAWIQYERLRFISSSREVHEAGRHVIRYTWGFMQQVAGQPPRDDEKDDGPFMLSRYWLRTFYIAVRQELGLPRPDDVYQEPDQWIPSQLRSRSDPIL